MPWCEECSKYFVPNALTTSGDCPKCGSTISQSNINGKPIVEIVTPETLDLRKLASLNGNQERVPWHFKLLVAMLVAYLSWRVVSLFI
ncbi:MAG: hypothetical protein EBS27_00750 [Actinobacteria bacterium]|nr:hypothetical protein [Actinomycetota bacterium]